MDGVARLNQVRFLDVVLWWTSPRRRSLPADVPAARLFARIEPYRTDPNPPGRGAGCGYQIGGVRFRLRPRVSDMGAVVLHGLCATRPGGGEGSVALRTICDAADASGTVLLLDARPYETPEVPAPMRRADLVAWYGRFGFRPTGTSGMQRDPVGGTGAP
jgi:hypothetical protein